jgi:hypothetical protein
MFLESGMMKNFRWLAVVILIGTGIFLGCGEDKKEQLINGVIYADRALDGVTANPLSEASYRGMVSNGKTPVDYVKATLPKEEKIFTNYVYNQPPKPWTIVIRPTNEPNELAIEGYGDDIKMPVKVEYATVNLPEE